MYISSQRVFAFSICALIFIGSLLGKAPGSAQNPASQAQSRGSSKPARRDSVEVVAKLSPEEVEEGKLNDAYQSIAQLQRKGTCTADIIERYRSEVIPAAEKSAFNVPKNKFLFLANRDIGNCYLDQKKFPEAEAQFEKILEYAPVWPGTDDSAYPINFREIATAQIGQAHWKDAEQSLLKSTALFDSMIAAWEKKDDAAEFTNNYRGSQSEGYALLAVVYFREGRTGDALDTIEKAYDEVTKYKLAAQYHAAVVSVGKAVAKASGDSKAQDIWSQRNP